MEKPGTTARVAPDLLKALAILSDTTKRRYAVDREGLKPYLKSCHKKGHISLGDQQSYYSKTLLTTEKKLSGWKFLAVDLSPTFSNTRTTIEIF